MLSDAPQQDGVYFVSKKKDEFEPVYIEARDREGRLYTDEVIANLPYVPKGHPYFAEWRLRQGSVDRIATYLSNKRSPLRILDLGCGNGWFSYRLALIQETEVVGLDVNVEELTQGARIFQRPNLTFVYADIFSSEANILDGFDIITANACVQYFEDLQGILDQLILKLKPGGELHILDSPFYQGIEVQHARERSIKYYQDLGTPEMAKYYFHHSLDSIQGYDILYKPSKSIFKKLLRQKENPFMWLKFIRD